MRSKAAAVVAVIGGLGLGLGALTATGSADETPTQPPTAGAADRHATPQSSSAGTTEPETPSRAGADTRHRHHDADEPSPSSRVTAGRPTGVRIDRLGVDTSVSAIEATGSSLVPPSDFTTVGWWADGPMPGSAQGTAIVIGHTVHTGGGAFDELGELQAGERVVIERRGRDLEYVVDTVTEYDKGALAQEAATVFASDVPGRVALVTCDDWNGSAYLSNQVVIATDPRPLAS